MRFTNFRTEENQLRFSEGQSLVWIDHSPICTKIVDLDLNLQFMSTAGVKSLGMDDVKEHYGKPYPFDFFPQSFRDRMSKNLKKARDTGEVIEQEAAVVDVNGNELWFHSTISPVSENGTQIDYLMIVSIETTAKNKATKELEQFNGKLEAKVQKRTLELERANQHLLQLSETDFLTKLPNRLAFNRRFEECIATAERNKQWLSLLMLDIDHFKLYNDKFGHDTGDTVLQKIADTICKSILRKTDLAARYGGEEFVILLPDADAESGLAMAEKIRTRIESLELHYDIPDITSSLTVSIGVASLKGNDLSATNLLKLADKALYVAKNAGRNNSQILTTL